MALIKSVKGLLPKMGKNCFLADNATLTGDVVMGDDCSVWFNAVVRGDVHSIRIGNNVNIQDGAIIHCTYQKAPVNIGNNVSIAHNAIIDRYRRDHETLALDEQTDLPAEADDPEDYLAEAETTEVLIKALAQLSADHQQVLVLRFINGLNHADTSRVLGRSEEAVRVLQHRALKALRTILMRHAVPERDVP